MRKSDKWVSFLASSLLVVILCVCLPVAAQEQPESAPPAEAAEAGLELLDEAMQAKLGAVRLKDLEQVVKLCEQALEAGLNDDNQSFARQMMTSTLYERRAACRTSLGWQHRPDLGAATRDGAAIAAQGHQAGCREW